MDYLVKYKWNAQKKYSYFDKILTYPYNEEMLHALKIFRFIDINYVFNLIKGWVELCNFII